MENENDVTLETTNEIVEETIETPAESTEETPETEAVDIAQLQATNKKLFERAKKAEAEAKALKSNRQTEAKAPSQNSIEETILLANGMSDELLLELKAVAKVRNMNLIKAQNDSIFVAIKDKFEKDRKHKEASLGASRGAGSVKTQKGINTPGLSREEHMKMVLESR